MIIDVAFKNAKVFNVQDRIDVVKGEAFTLFTDAPENTRWFTDNDPVLSVKAQGQNAGFSADAIGPSTIFLIGDADALLKKLQINVVASIEEPAANLNTSAGTPVNK